MVTDVINTGITGPQINIKKYVMILPLLVWVGHRSTGSEPQCAPIHHVKGGRSCPQRAEFLGAVWNKKTLPVVTAWNHCRHANPHVLLEVSGTIYMSKSPLVCALVSLSCRTVSGQPSSNTLCHFQLHVDFCTSAAAAKAGP